ncbi:hypothetical protein COU91_01315 [Candidatus Saccharibacteria bacterium CG10_big_fil_rev_8_21_14_0_10_47_8]|nr:MAG: hypothetical protein COU91_01315 [Candidatus Saccharibacteria bacterium CG10_big_fil_rev_8_21_14_0_10_47_8]
MALTMFNECRNSQCSNVLNHLAFVIYQFTLIYHLAFVIVATIFGSVCKMLNVKSLMLIASEGGA